MHRRVVSTGTALALSLVLAGCDEQLSDLTGPTPNLQPTLTSIQREIFDTTDSSGRQACITCHASVGGRGPAAGLNLSQGASHAALVGVPSLLKPGAIRVIPGDPEGSYLIHKLEGRSDIVGTRMPRGTGPYLTDGQIEVLKRWISVGAPNN